MSKFQFAKTDDKIIWVLGKNNLFSVKAMYNVLTKTEEGTDFKIIWKGKAPQKIKIFMWLVANNAILTKDNLLKRKWSGDPNCMFCESKESVNHLFFTCPTAKVVWIVIAKYIGVDDIPESLNQCWKWCEKWLPAGKKIHMWGVSVVCWAIWKAQNKACFEGVLIKNPIQIICHAGALMRFWTGLYADVEKMLINGVNTMLKVAAELLLPKKSGGDEKCLKHDEDML